MLRKTKFITKYNYGNEVVDLDEYVVAFSDSCYLNCEYCYLKFSKTPKLPVIYQNFNKFESELKELLSLSKEKIFYFNFGETTDTLMSEQHFNCLYDSVLLISNLAKKFNKLCFIEIRTKTKNIYKLSKPFIFQNVYTIYATTLSPQEVVNNFEPNTASTKDRIESIKYANQLGMLTGLRFEPIILYPVEGIFYKNVVDSVENVVKSYKLLINEIFQKVNVKNLHSVTLSCLRLTKKQFKYLLDKKSVLCHFEMLLCQDKKYRYSRPIRVTIYRQLIEHIKKVSPELNNRILLSFEFKYIWESCGLKLQTLPQLGYNYAT